MAINIGASVRACREAKGLSQRGLAERVGCTAPYLSFIERELRDPRISMLKLIAGALGVSLLELLDYPLRRDIGDRIRRA